MKKTIASLLTLLMTVFFVTPISANSKNDTDNAVSVPVKVEATLTNSETGQKQELKFDISNFKNVKILDSNGDQKHYKASGDVFLEIDNDPLRPQLKSSQSHDRNKYGVTTSATVYYTMKDNNTKIDITKVSGSWISDSSLYLINEPRVIVRQYQFSGKLLMKYVNVTNRNKVSFSYPINWGYIPRADIGSANAPYVYTSCDITIAGMSSTHYFLEMRYTF